MNKEKLAIYLERYAKVLLEVGLAIRPGDGMMMRLDEHSLPLARILSREAYKLGVKDIIYDFMDDQISLDHFLYGSEQALTSYPAFKVDYREQAFLQNYHSLYLVSPNPSLLKDADSKKVAAWQKTISAAFKPIQHYQMNNKVKWCVAAAAGPAWARMVFPDLAEAEGVLALWDLIFDATRMKEDDPVAAWQQHEHRLKEKEAFLDGCAFEKLLYRAPGTELEVYLVEGHRWIGGCSRLPRGDQFMANIPTEEIFTMPHARRVNGTLRATKPLSLQGKLVENFSFVFKDGEVVSFEAEKGRDVLEQLMEMDAGAKRLGEVAIVPDDSPISNTGVLFFNTLFDENASCHFALGSAYGENLEGADELDEQAKEAIGMNESMIHVDFMVGGPELEIIGVRPDGTEVPLLRKGNWVE